MGDKRDEVPVLDLETKAIDFGQVAIQEDKHRHGPSLKLSDYKPGQSTVLVFIVKRVAHFLRDFKAYYAEQITECLFDQLAFKLMRRALVDVEMDTTYWQRIEAETDRRYTTVCRVVLEILRMDRLMAGISRQLLSASRKPDEDANVYSERVFDLMDMSGTDTWEERLCKSFLHSLPEQGQER
ncbi:hypothetical protein BGZ73_002080, partial [Actinomortierella ambigua]